MISKRDESDKTFTLYYIGRITGTKNEILFRKKSENENPIEFESHFSKKYPK